MDTKIFDVLHQPVRHDQEAGVDSTILAWSDNLMLAHYYSKRQHARDASGRICA